MLKIGEFSKLSHLTVKALRFYEKEKLLVPASIDEWTGTDFMKPASWRRPQKKAYRQLDLSIEEIKAIYSGTDVRKILSKKAKSLSAQREENGYQVAGLARECYIDGIWNKESVEDWLTEIQLPIEG